MSAFADQQLAPDRGAGFLTFCPACFQILALHSLLFHNSLHPFKFFYGDDGFMLALYLGKFHLAVVFYFFLFQIVGNIFLVVGDDAAVEGVLQNMRDHCGEPLVLALGGFVAPPFQFIFDLYQTAAL